MNKQNYEDRIGRLIRVLQEIASGKLGPLNVCSIARQAVNNDMFLADQHRSEAGED